MRDLLLEIAVDAGYGVYCASGALEAMAVLGRELPGAVLVDLDMPNATGERFLSIFRQLRTDGDVICIAVSSRPSAKLASEVLFLPKPELAGLAEALERHFVSSSRIPRTLSRSAPPDLASVLRP